MRRAKKSVAAKYNLLVQWYLYESPFVTYPDEQQAMLEFDIMQCRSINILILCFFFKILAMVNFSAFFYVFLSFP